MLEAAEVGPGLFFFVRFNFRSGTSSATQILESLGQGLEFSLLHRTCTYVRVFCSISFACSGLSSLGLAALRKLKVALQSACPFSSRFSPTPLHPRWAWG